MNLQSPKALVILAAAVCIGACGSEPTGPEETTSEGALRSARALRAPITLPPGSKFAQGLGAVLPTADSAEFGLQIQKAAVLEPPAVITCKTLTGRADRFLGCTLEPVTEVPSEVPIVDLPSLFLRAAENESSDL